MKERVNFHTHTAWCHHALGHPEEYCRCALAQGVGVLGFSDHNPFSDADSAEIGAEKPSVIACRMSYVEMEKYRREIREAQEKFPELQIYAGLEIDYFPWIGNDYYRELAEKFQLDYLLGGDHTALRPEVASEDAESRALKAVSGTVKMLESGLIFYLCHPDLFAGSGVTMTDNLRSACRDLLATAAGLGIPVEFNAYGLRKKKITDLGGRGRAPYPWREFWELAAEYPVSVVIGADAHQPEDVWSNGEAAEKLAAEWGLRPDNGILLKRMEIWKK